jgi:protein-S-isoprenylcysteine O-methyltransferase Ste14
MGALATGLGLDRDRAFYPVVTMVIASYYALFAVMGASTPALVLESLAGAAFLILAAAGFRRSLWVVVVALVAHGVFDYVHAELISNPGVPHWWPDFCLTYDLTAAAYLACLLKSGRVHASTQLGSHRTLGMRWLELKIPPLFVVLVFAGAMWGVAHAAPRLSFMLAGNFAIALVLGALGGALAAAGVAAFRRRRTTVNPLTPSASTFVVSSGVYRVSRNPMYLGFVLALAGWALYLSNAGAALLLPAFTAYMTQYQIKPEERALLAKFGPEFARYMSRVRRWL